MFRAIGVLRGELKINPEDNLVYITLQGREFKLYPRPARPAAYKSLCDRIRAGKQGQYLLVYPKFIHLPERDKEPIISFQVVGFRDKPYPELSPGEFKLQGVWQFIPVCKTPCVSVHRNRTEESKKERMPLALFVKRMRANHLPLIWRDSVVPPIRFNPKAEVQGKKFFVAVKAKFLPNRGLFGFDSLLGMPTEEIPPFLKVTKKHQEKLIAQKLAEMKRRRKEEAEAKKRSAVKRRREEEAYKNRVKEDDKNYTPAQKPTKKTTEPEPVGVLQRCGS